MPAADPGELAQWQIDVATARVALLAECERIAAAGALHIARAEQLLVDRARAGELAPELLEVARLANARRGAGRSLSIQRLSAWRKIAACASTPAERMRSLAPRGRGKRWTLEGNVAVALAKFRQPNKPALRWCVREVVGNEGPEFRKLYARCRRELKKLPAPLFYPGRHTGAALKALLPFRRREFLSLAPNDVWVGDGHSAKLRIANPDTGAPFVPEITLIMDVATRYVVGWSLALSENCIAVSDAMRHAISRHGIPLVYYSDGGAGQTAKMLDAPVTGILGALGVHHETGRPGNPQGRGVIERAWQTITIPLARRFATFQGKGADRETLRKVTIGIARELREAKKSQLAVLPSRLPTFNEFVSALEAEIAAYNEQHRHRSLPKIDGSQHATPAEYRASRLASVAPEIPQPQELAALFMPSVLRVAARGEVKLWNGIYFHRDLMLVDGEEVRVCYDIHDATYVLIRRISGEFICKAELGGNRSGYMPQPFLEKLRDERAARRSARLEAQLGEIQVERHGRTAFTPAPAPAPEAELLADMARIEAEAQAPQTVNLLELDESGRHDYWKSLDERRAAGEVLQGPDADFYSHWPTQDYYRIAVEAEREFEEQLAATRAQQSA